MEKGQNTEAAASSDQKQRSVKQQQETRETREIAAQHIAVVTTGGTIEKSYLEFDGSLLNSGSIIENKLFSRLRTPHKNFIFHHILTKDSLDMTSLDRELIATTVNDCLANNHPVIVIHGTDTMVESAVYCQNYLSDHHDSSSLAVPVIFTGAMKPLGFVDSDALQNVAEAIAHLSTAAAGVYISFHSELYPLPNVRKNHEKLTFEQVPSA